MSTGLQVVAWACDVCCRPVAEGAGYLCCSYRALREHADATRDWEERHSESFAVQVGELLELPELVPWRVLHRDCDPDPESPDYWIGVERIRTPADVIRWGSHLLGKQWIQDTTWADVLGGVADQLEGEERSAV